MKAIIQISGLLLFLTNCSQSNKEVSHHKLMSSPMSLSHAGNATNEISVELQKERIDRNFNGCKAHE
jgi:hypothetical protein